MNPIRRRRSGGGSPYKNLAARFVSASTQYGEIASNANLSTSGGLTITAWVYLDAVATNALVAKAANLNIEYELGVQTNVFRSLLSANGSTQNTRSASTFGVLSTNTWYFVAAWYDSVGLTNNISVNNGTVDSQAFTGPPFTGTSSFRIGADSFGTLSNSRLDSVGLWARTLTAAEITMLYNNGIGLAYNDLSPQLKTTLCAWYDLDGDLRDKSGLSNHLNNVGGVTFVPGKR